MPMRNSLKHKNSAHRLKRHAAAHSVLFSCAMIMVFAGWQQQTVAEAKLEAAWKQANTTPTAAYPETVTYTLAKMSGANNSSMPEGDTYENNAYTRYLMDKLNVQNEDVIEVAEDDNYELYIRHMIMERNIPDVMLVFDLDTLEQLVENDMVEDLTAAYKNCTSDTIKEIYDSYGAGLLDSVTFDGKLMALPSTEVYSGCNLFWVRQDWLEELHLEEPKTVTDVEQIILAFKNAGHPMGLACDVNLVGQESANYSLDPVFGAYHAYPQKWIKDDNGEMVYGSITGETKQALGKLNTWYRKGIIDEDYMMRTPTEIGELVKNGDCGAFFGCVH
ncbi:MAG: hypothetical protein PHP50_04870 [Lachnospiraceae bacterium]|nr:hypothetical protein [Lachnospiraceae bacterium]